MRDGIHQPMDQYNVKPDYRTITIYIRIVFGCQNKWRKCDTNNKINSGLFLSKGCIAKSKGARTRRRTCQIPKPALSAATCQGPTTDVQVRYAQGPETVFTAKLMQTQLRFCNFQILSFIFDDLGQQLNAEKLFSFFYFMNPVK